MITGKHLPRRSFLKGLGTAVALPWLDAMTPAFAASSRLGSNPPLRLAFAYVPNGVIMSQWTPQAEGGAYELSHLLEPVAEVKDKVLVLSGLTHNGGRALGDGPGDHARAASTFLTGVHPKKTAGSDIQVGVSADQVAAQVIGHETKFASLEIGCEDGRVVGSCDSGYSCAYSNSIAWKTPSTPLPPEINPRSVFERLFAGWETGEDAAMRARRQRYNRSILDFVMEDTAKLEGKLGPTDRRKMDEYLTAVREIETRIQRAELQPAEIAPPMGKPDGIPIDYTDHCRLMFDLLAIAFQADLTRIATFMLGREGSNRAYREIGISDAHHPLTHHRNNPEMIAKVTQINRYHMEQFAYFLRKLNSMKEGDGTLLDHCMIVYGSGLSDGNRHQHNDLPCLVAGSAAGKLRTGRHVRYAAETPMTNLYLAMLDRVGVKPEHLGDSDGELNHLTDL